MGKSKSTRATPTLPPSSWGASAPCAPSLSARRVSPARRPRRSALSALARTVDSLQALPELLKSAADHPAPESRATPCERARLLALLAD